MDESRIPEFTGETRAEVEAWLDKVVAVLGWGFHPDTRGRDYVEDVTGERTFTAEEAETLDRGVERLFGISGDPYDLGMAAVRRWAAEHDPETLARFVS